MQDYRIELTDIDEKGYLKETYPEEIDGKFYAIQVPLKFLKGVPKKIGGSFSCTTCPIQTLIDGPQWVRERYYCSETEISSLEGGAEYVGENLYLIGNKKLKSLEGIGRKYFKEVHGNILLSSTPLQSHMLGLLLVKNLSGLSFNDNQQLTEIINKHLKADRDILECQEELINNGFKDYAKL